MNRPLAFLIAGLIGLAKVTAILVCPGVAVDLPETWSYAFVLSSVPNSVPLGAREEELDQYFEGLPRRIGGAAAPSKCVRYQYSSDEVVTLFLDHGVVTAMWVSAATSVPKECEGLVARTTFIAKPRIAEAVHWVCEGLPVRH